MKTILITLGMAVVLFVYGYIASTAGHDHGSHDNAVHKEDDSKGHGEHDHAHH